MRRVRATWLSKAEPKDFSQTSRDLAKRAAGFLLKLKDHPAELEKSLEPRGKLILGARAPRPHAADTLSFLKAFRTEVGSRFALIAGEGARAPSVHDSSECFLRGNTELWDSKIGAAR